jgi:hypothetical protein
VVLEMIGVGSAVLDVRYPDADRRIDRQGFHRMKGESRRRIIRIGWYCWLALSLVLNSVALTLGHRSQQEKRQPALRRRAVAPLINLVRIPVPRDQLVDVVG